MNDPLESLDDLLAPFYASHTPRHKWVVGTEAEKFGVRSDGSPVPYAGSNGVAEVLRRLSSKHGWIATPETEGGPLIAMVRGWASITLEPGAQLELSGAPLDTVHGTCSEFRGHLAELNSVSEDLDIHWLGLGYHPLARQEDLDWVPKLRYGVMKDYLMTKGSRGRDMMRRTCTVQANLDYADEADAMQKLRISLAATPVVTAMFANSPWSEGKTTGQLSHRAGVWLDVDPDRTGLLPFLWENPNAGYEAYVDWALDVPMFLIKREGGLVLNTGQTFRAFMKDGYEGHHATAKDWNTHINTLFPEVRLKNTIEMRSTDSQAVGMVCALPALWKGLLYDDAARSQTEALFADVDYAQANSAQRAVPDQAMRADYAGKEIGEWASELLSIASAGLERLGHLNGAGKDERIFLQPLIDLDGKCPADQLLENAPGERPDVKAIIEASRY